MWRVRSILAVAAAAGLGGAAFAERLGKEACDGLRGEQARLVAAGARNDMQRGPEWAKANLGPDRLSRIRNLMGVEEQLIFRCDSLRPQPETTAEPKAAERDEAKADSHEKKPVAKSKPRKARPAEKQADDEATSQSPPRQNKVAKTADTGSDAGGEATPKPRKAQKAKTKADDAYVPPPRKAGDGEGKN